MKLAFRLPFGDPWLLVLTGSGLLVAAGLLLWLTVVVSVPLALAQSLVGLILFTAWMAAIRFVLLDSWGRVFWLIVNLLSFVLVITLGMGGLITGIALSSLFLTFRSYQPWRLVSARRRAVGFGLGIVALVLLFVLRRSWDQAFEDSAPAFLGYLGGWSLFSLIMFWGWSLFHLAIRMRLHFLRLRPKLAVSAVLIGLVPLFLVVVLGLMILYTGLGGARAARTTATLESWRVMTAGGADLSGALFDSTFVWPESAATGVESGRIPAPDWVPEMADRLQYALKGEARVKGDTTGAVPTAVADTTDWFLGGQRLWLMRWQGLDGDEPRVHAWHLGHRPLTELSRLLKAGIDVSAMDGEDDEDIVVAVGGDELDDGPVEETMEEAVEDVVDEVMEGESEEMAEDFAEGFIDGFTGDGPRDSASPATAGPDPGSFPGLQVRYRETEDGKGYWNKFFYFGGTLFTVNRLEEGALDTATMFLNLRVGWEDLQAEFLEGDSNLNIAVVVGLSIMAFLFLVLEIFAFFFGVRISEGIVSATHALHRGTREVAAGNLDTVIDIPNEDEFGDLATSFNDMTQAVKQGREIALANEALRQELEMARAIQVRLLPSLEPVLKGFEVTGASIPSHEIGGDYFDFLAQGEDKIGIAIGDVSGKGMPAALLMSNLQASLHGQVLHQESVSGVVKNVNDLIVHSTDPHMFATFFYGLLDVRNATMTCTNAGHNPPLLLRNDGSIQELTLGGLLLGMVGDQVYQQETVELAPGEVVVMYTDGITEAVGPGADEEDFDSMFGEEALYEVLRASRHLPASGIKEAILEAVARHTEGETQSDDITLVVIRRQG